MRITHKPTGVIAEASGGWKASLHKLKDQAMEVLRARVRARQMGLEKPTEITHDYEFPEGKPWPNDIAEYRRILASEGEQK
ncbi:hypothetical protein QZM35_17225 [Burkholderia sp. AU45274]|uniref:hypothetical protein n=1 Tax=Burkholderia sp. AU45274 TaxID=3059205 RepID=UPI002655E923|nr:hypothetical protein [Burkholderia sp. AU45274]MDN7489452.1 hypothetical protein [Burkholderia sp. AU45274]